MRDSEDEEMIADIIISILLGQPFARSKEELDMVYNEESEIYQRIQNALIAYPAEKLYLEVKELFSVIREIKEVPTILHANIWSYRKLYILTTRRASISKRRC